MRSILLLIFFLSITGIHQVQAGSALPANPQSTTTYPSSGFDREERDSQKKTHRSELRQQRKERRQAVFKRFTKSKGWRYLRAFLLFAALGTGLYVLGSLIAAGTILAGVITTAVLLEYLSLGLFIGAYVCYLYALYTGIFGLVLIILEGNDID